MSTTTIYATDDLRAEMASPTAKEAVAGHALPRTAYLSVHATSEYGDHPRFARLTIDQALIDHLTQLSALCIEKQLNRVTVNGSPDAWGAAEDTEDLRLQGDELVVDLDSFWFTSDPKHADYSIETEMLSYRELKTALEAYPDGIVHLGTEDYLDEIEEMEAENPVATSGRKP